MAQTLDILKLGGAVLAALEKLGAEVEMTTDFARAEEIAARLGKAGQKPILSSKKNDFTEESAFWLFLKQDGVYIASVAARVDNICRESMQSYLKRILLRHYPEEINVDTLTVSDSLPGDFFGRLVHIGELFVDPKARGSRRKLRLFMMAMQVAIAVKWQADWVYAFMRDRDVQLGFATFYGFTMQIPGFADWHGKVPAGRGASDWMIALPAAHQKHMIHYYAASFESL